MSFVIPESNAFASTDETNNKRAREFVELFEDIYLPADRTNPNDYRNVIVYTRALHMDTYLLNSLFDLLIKEESATTVEGFKYILPTIEEIENKISNPPNEFMGGPTLKAKLDLLTTLINNDNIDRVVLRMGYKDVHNYLLSCLPNNTVDCMEECAMLVKSILSSKEEIYSILHYAPDIFFKAIQRFSITGYNDIVDITQILESDYLQHLLIITEHLSTEKSVTEHEYNDEFLCLMMKSVAEDISEVLQGNLRELSRIIYSEPSELIHELEARSSYYNFHRHFITNEVIGKSYRMAQFMSYI